MRIHNIKISKESKRKLKNIDFYSKHLYKICTNAIDMAGKWRLYMKPCSSLTMRYKQLLEHGLCQYCRKPCPACCHQTITTAGTWSLSIIQVISAPSVVMNVIRQLEFDLCTFYGQQRYT